MKTDKRFLILTAVLSCITCVGTTLALVSFSPSEEINTSVIHRTGELRPTLTRLPDPWLVSIRQEAEPNARFAFVPENIGPLTLPSEYFEGAANPQSWTMDVSELPSSPRSPKKSLTHSNTRSVIGKRKSKGRYTLNERLAEISPAALARVTAKFKSANVSWPPAEIAFVAIKDEKSLEVYSRPKGGAWQFVHRYRVLAASGASGPKLQRGDKQVPEGVYRITYLNPNSAYHVSLRVNYPNSFDRKMARKDRRKDLGGDIMIHGKNTSAGCLAIGDASAEELFVLTAEVGKRNVKVVIAPTDFRRKNVGFVANGPVWVPTLYTKLASAMSEFKAPPRTPNLLTLLGL